jgi:hypothetical protein
MKSFLEVEKTRTAYHSNPSKNTVHRSSLFAPRMEGCDTLISFLNHFLIKRKNESVGMKLSAYDKHQVPLDSYWEDIKEPRVHRYNLDEIFNSVVATTYQIEFFSSINLFIPFPAVVIEHRNKNSNNIIHSYNRILNDFSDEYYVNANQVKEASIDLLNNDNFTTAIIFQAGPSEVKEKIIIELDYNGKNEKHGIELNCKPFEVRRFDIADLTSEKIAMGVCKVKQPYQFMFYGRLLAGLFSKKQKGVFAANHSYYDNSEISEYFTNNTSSRICPYFKGKSNALHFYPINSPSKLRVILEVKGKEFDVGEIESPGSNVLMINVDEIFEEHGVDVSCYNLKCISKEKMPTRTNHQLVVGDLNSPLKASINISLLNDEVFYPGNKKSLCWGSFYLDKSYDTLLSVLSKTKSLGLNGVLRFYDEKGKIYSIDLDVPKYEAFILSSKDLFGHFETEDNMLWYWFESEGNSEVQAFSVHTNTLSLVSSGEHNF